MSLFSHARGPVSIQSCTLYPSCHISIMKTYKVGLTHWCRGMLCLSLISAWAAGGAEPTALSLIKEGNRYLGEQSKDKVLEIRSEERRVGKECRSRWSPY